MKTTVLIMTSLITLSFFLSCDASFQKRITNTEQTIKDAEKINAKKYARQDLQDAGNALKEAKDAIAKGNKKEATKKTLIAENKAQKAYHNTIKNYVASEKKLTKDSIDDAERKGAHVLAPDEYNKAKKLSDKIEKDSKRLRELELKLKKLKKK